MKMKKITNPKWMKLLKVLHLLGMILLCAGLLGAKLLLLQPDPDLPTVALLGANFTRNGGILLLGTGLIYNLFTRYGVKRMWIVLKWVATAALIAISVLLPASVLIVAVQLLLLLFMIAASVYKWQ